MGVDLIDRMVRARADLLAAADEIEKLTGVWADDVSDHRGRVWGYDGAALYVLREGTPNYITGHGRAPVDLGVGICGVVQEDHEVSSILHLFTTTLRDDARVS